MANDILKDLRETLELMRNHGVRAPYVCDVPAKYALMVYDELVALGIRVDEPVVGGCMNVEFREVGQLTLRVH